MWERKFEKKFFKKSHVQTPNGVLLIFKLPFPNGSCRNGVCRGLWAKSINSFSLSPKLALARKSQADSLGFLSFFLFQSAFSRHCVSSSVLTMIYFYSAEVCRILQRLVCYSTLLCPLGWGPNVLICYHGPWLSSFQSTTPHCVILLLNAFWKSCLGILKTLWNAINCYEMLNDPIEF